jgi:DNA-binding NarL/FixJ family response regulator
MARLVIPRKSTMPSVFPARTFAVAFSRDDPAGAAKTHADAARVLVVEDDYLVAAEIESALDTAGFDVIGIANSADEALERAAAERPLLAVMDIRLNGRRDGIEAALELFAAHGIRCIFATAHQTADARGRANPAKPIAWLPKPYTMPTLVAVVRQAVEDLRRKP